MMAQLVSAGLALAAAAASTISAPGPSAPLSGTLLSAGVGAPVVVILPGSGPTDRDGNNSMGITAAPYRLLAEALAQRGISTVRIDKRGMFASKAAIADPNAVTVEDYAADAHAWATVAARQSAAKCVWLLGHSEGGLIALKAAQEPHGLCGVILVAAPGRKLGTVMREQFQANPANAPILPAALAAIDAFEAGKRVDPTTLPPPLPFVFSAAVQGFVIDLFAQDPAALAAQLRLPVLIIQGQSDLQVAEADALALKAAAPAARLALLPGVNHVLKAVPGSDRAANAATYRDPTVPVAPSVVDAIAGFVKEK